MRADPDRSVGPGEKPAILNPTFPLGATPRRCSPRKQPCGPNGRACMRTADAVHLDLGGAAYSASVGIASAAGCGWAARGHGGRLSLERRAAGIPTPQPARRKVLKKKAPLVTLVIGAVYRSTGSAACSGG